MVFRYYLIICILLFILCVARSSESLSEVLVHTVRLKPGEDIELSLHKWFTDNDIYAASIISCVGSLREINLRLANSMSYLKFVNKYEIVSLSGTIARETKTCLADAHIHISLADGNGTVIGGHLMPGNIVYTTAEITLAVPKSLEFVREHDPETGYLELVVYPSLIADKAIESCSEEVCKNSNEKRRCLG